jgi:hypothetical protein
VSRESTLPMIHYLSPERAQSYTLTGASYLVNDNFSEAASYSQEDDVGTLILPHDAPAERFLPAYHSSWVFRNAPPDSDHGEASFFIMLWSLCSPRSLIDQVLLDQTD